MASEFLQQDITDAGLLLLAKVQAQGIPLTFTKISIGSGYLPDGATPRTMESLASPVINMAITKKVVNADRTATIGGVFTNSEVQEQFYFRELALFAQDPDLGEVLYCYGNAGDTAELIPAHSSSTLVEKIIDVVTIIGNATTVTAFMASEAYATKADVESLTVSIKALGDQIDGVQEDATAALDALPGIRVEISDLRTRVSDNTARTDTLWNAIFTDITENPFLLVFTDLDGANITSGVWNKALERMEC